MKRELTPKQRLIRINKLINDSINLNFSREIIRSYYEDRDKIKDEIKKESELWVNPYSI